MISLRLYTSSAARRVVPRLARRCLSSDEGTKQQTLYMWGTNSDGSLLDLPKKVQVPTLVDWRLKLDVQDDSVSLQEVVCGPTDTALVLSDGRCYVAGQNKQGQLGLGHRNPVSDLTLIPNISVKNISLGPVSSALVDSKGDLYTFGSGGGHVMKGGVGQLGHGDAESVLTPKLVESIVEDGCWTKQVTVGESHTTILTTEGEVLCTGAGSYGRLGNFETVDQVFFEPVELLTSGVDQIAGGKSFTLALRDGIVYGWGRNHKGQLGTGYGMAVDMYAMSEVPSEVVSDELAMKKVIKIAAGHSLAACLTDKGELYYWGMSLYLEPEYVNALVHTKIVDVACGDDYWIALGADGLLYSYGTGKTGVLGEEGVKQQNQASLLEALADKKVVNVSAGWKHVAAIVED